MKTIEELYLERQEEKERLKKEERINEVIQLGNKFNDVLLDEKFKKAASELLIEHGCIHLENMQAEIKLTEKEFLITGMKDAVEYWENQGVNISLIGDSKLFVKGHYKSNCPTLSLKSLS